MVAEGRGGRAQEGSSAWDAHREPGAVLGHLEHLGLSAIEARVLVALMRVSTGTAAELAGPSRVHRTSVYQVLEELSAKGLAKALPGKVASWAALDAPMVLSRLMAAQEEHVEQLRAETDHLRNALMELSSETPPAALAQVQLVRTSAEVKRTYERLLSEAQSELRAFVKPPYAWSPTSTNPVWFAALERGVTIRSLYAMDPGLRGVTTSLRQGVNAGEQARSIDDLPMKMAVFDRRCAIVAMTDPGKPLDQYPTAMLIDHRGFASWLADAFEVRWELGRAFGEGPAVLTPASAVPG